MSRGKEIETFYKKKSHEFTRKIFSCQKRLLRGSENSEISLNGFNSWIVIFCLIIIFFLDWIHNKRKTEWVIKKQRKKSHHLLMLFDPEENKLLIFIWLIKNIHIFFPSKIFDIVFQFFFFSNNSTNFFLVVFIFISIFSIDKLITIICIIFCCEKSRRQAWFSYLSDLL